MSKQTFTTGQVLTSVEMTTLQANDYNQTVSAKVASYVLVAADAGTRITMSNASTTTITVNTALFTAGDTLIITNIGAGVCTVTAGTATVSTGGSFALSQYDSGTLYFTSTGVAIWNGANPGDITGVTAGTGISGGGTSGTVTVTNSMATTITTAGDLLYGTGSGTVSRLGIGSSAQVLTVAGGVPSWATPAAGGGSFTLVKSASFSAVGNTSTTFDNIFTSTYVNYYFVFNITTSAASILKYQVRTAVPATIAADYQGSVRSVTSANPGVQTLLGTAGYATSCNIGTTGGIYYDTWYGQITGMNANPSTGNHCSIFGKALIQAGAVSVDYNYHIDNPTTATGFILTTTSGTMTGNCYIYGMAV